MPKRINQKGKGIKIVSRCSPSVPTSSVSSFYIFFLIFQVSDLTTIDSKNNGNDCGQVRKHGIGKGLMTVSRIVNPEGGDIPTGIDFSNQQIVPPQTSSSAWRTNHLATKGCCH